MRNRKTDNGKKGRGKGIKTKNDKEDVRSSRTSQIKKEDRYMKRGR